jgi:microcystin-dependent protein
MKRLLAATAVIAGLGGSAATAQDSYLGEIKLFGFNFCPRTTLPAHGQLLGIAENSALFSLLGTTYGGDGRTTFALPDMRGRSAIGQGQGPGLPNYAMGSKGGATQVTISPAQMPAHTHSATGTPSGVPTPGNSPNPAGNAPALTTTSQAYAPLAGAGIAMATGSVAVTVASSGEGSRCLWKIHS